MERLTLLADSIGTTITGLQLLSADLSSSFVRLVCLNLVLAPILAAREIQSATIRKRLPGTVVLPRGLVRESKRVCGLTVTLSCMGIWCCQENTSISRAPLTQDLGSVKTSNCAGGAFICAFLVI